MKDKTKKLNSIKVINKRIEGGSLFHYAHFICDCLFPEVISDIPQYQNVFRLKNLDQTLGNFEKIYNQVFGSVNIELCENSFDKINCEEKTIARLPCHENISDFKKFVNFVFNSLSINNIDKPNLPEVLLIKRGLTKELISDPELKKINNNTSNGKDRREIKHIDRVSKRLKEKYGDKFCSLVLEDVDFTDQVLHFHNAKIIVCAHGAAMANLFFCQPGTTVIEVGYNSNAQTPEDKSIGKGGFRFFDTICSVLNLNQHKIKRNNGFDLLKYIDSL